MTRSLQVLVTAWLVMAVLPSGLALAQKSLPQVPVTYPGDTDETIKRRAQWIEGAKKEGTVVWWGTTKPAQVRAFASEFNKVYPYISLTAWNSTGEEISTKVEAEYAGRSYTADIIDGGNPYNYPRWRKIGIMERFTDLIPGVEKWDKRMISRYGDAVQLGHNATVPMYNTKLVSAAEAPKSWEDLLDPKWKGQIGVTTDVRVWYVLALAEGGWGIVKTENFLRKLKQQQPIWAPGHTAGFSLLIAGEYKIMGEDFLRYIFASQHNVPIDWVRVRPVSVAGSYTLLTKRAPHPNAARLFLEWLLSPQGLILAEKVTGLGAAPPGSGTRLSQALEGLDIVYRTEDVILKVADLNIIPRFAKILGVTPE